MAFYYILVLVLIAADQLIKRWAMVSLQPVGTMKLLPILSLTYVENRGAAFLVSPENDAAVITRCE